MDELSRHEEIILDALTGAAAQGIVCPKNEDLMELINASSTSTVPQIIERLIDKGLLSREVYQRSRQICIIETGKCTAAPNSRQPHWRDRPRAQRLPTPAPHSIRTIQPDVGEAIMQWARARGVPYSEALADLVFVGWEVERGRT